MTGAAPTPRVDLRIDRLVIDSAVGWDAGERERFRAGVEAELARLLTEHGLRSAGRASEGGRAAPVDLRGAPVVDCAAQVAGQVYDQVCDRAAGARTNGTARP